MMKPLTVARFFSSYTNACVRKALLPLLVLMVGTTVLSRLHLGRAARGFVSVAALALVYETSKHAKKIIRRQLSDDSGPTPRFVRLFGWMALGAIVLMDLFVASTARLISRA